eukprot:403367578
MDSINIAKYTYSQSAFIKETIKHHLTSLRQNLDQFYTQNSAQQKPLDAVNSFFKINWKSLLSMIFHTESFKDLQNHLMNSINEILKHKIIQKFKIVKQVFETHLLMSEILFNQSLENSKLKKKFTTLKKLLRAIHLHLNLDEQDYQTLEVEELMSDSISATFIQIGQTHHTSSELNFPNWFMDSIVLPYAYKMPDFVKQLCEKLDLQEFKIDQQIEHYLEFSKKMSKKRKFGDSFQEDCQKNVSCKNSKRRQQLTSGNIPQHEIQLSGNQKSVKFEVQPAKQIPLMKQTSRQLVSVLKSENLKQFEKQQNESVIVQKFQLFDLKNSDSILTQKQKYSDQMSSSQFSYSTLDNTQQFTQSQRSQSAESIRSFATQQSTKAQPFSQRVFNSQVSNQKRAALRFNGSITTYQMQMKRAKSIMQPQKSTLLQKIGKVSALNSQNQSSEMKIVNIAQQIPHQKTTLINIFDEIM